MSVRESDVQLDHDARLSAMEFDPLHSDFLSAQTKAFHDAISSQIYASDPYWDEYVVTSAVHYRSLIGGITVENSEVGHQLTVIRTYLLDVFSDYGKYERFLSYRGDAAQDLLDLLQKIFDVVSGMQYLHGNGIVHADLKCANILVGEDERACLADFGLSYIKGYTNEALSSVAALGTPRFLAPELLDPDIEDARRTEASDIFAFGMVCYEASDKDRHAATSKFT
ncbi:hypothetical protein H0H92_001664 [Tricholoma furcatifolium]|nr:hypothetical protein H0H92_001664 [Tricholoma furcatifolium]